MVKLRRADQCYLERTMTSDSKEPPAIVDRHPPISSKIKIVVEDDEVHPESLIVNEAPVSESVNDQLFIIPEEFLVHHEEGSEAPSVSPEKTATNSVEDISETIISTPQPEEIPTKVLATKPVLAVPRHKPNIVISETVSQLLKKSGIITSQQVRQDVAASREAAAVKRKHEIERFEAASAKRIHRAQENEFPPKFVMVPLFAITDRRPSIKSSAIDQHHRIKQLEMISVHVSVSALNRFNFSDLATNHSDHPASPKTMFMCTFCPKAYATSPLLIMHTRKTHVCQFCLRGFAQLGELQEHIRTAHVLIWCPLCNQQFECNSNLRAHVKRTHGIQLPAHVSLLTQLDDISDEVLIVMDAEEEEEEGGE